MAYTVVARRYRPQTFAEVVGQEHVATTLRNAILEGRIAHAYLFAGPRGVGKTSMARIFAKALNCTKGPTESPCGTCEFCRSIAEGNDADVIEMDAASNRGIEDARTLREGVRYAPLRSRFKLYIIDEAHQLTRDAFNALLKTLEEPPPHVKFVFATTEPQKILPTILSRCQTFEFRRIRGEHVLLRLRQVCAAEGKPLADDVLRAVVRAGGGSMRDAQSLLDQLLTYRGTEASAADVERILGAIPAERLLRTMDLVKAGDLPGLFAEVDTLFDQGRDPAAFLDLLLRHCRDLLVLSACGAGSPVVDLPQDLMPAYEAQAKAFGEESMLYHAQLLAESRRRLAQERAEPRIVLELTLAKMARAGAVLPVHELVRRIDAVLAGAPAGPVRTEPTARAAVETPMPHPAPASSASPASAPASARVLKSAPHSPAVPAPPPASAPRTIPVTARAAAVPSPGAVPAADDGGEDAETDGTLAEPSVPADIAGVRRHWSRVIEAVKGKSMSLAGFVREAVPARVDDAELTLEFPAMFSMHKKQVEYPERLRVVEECAATVLGKRRAIRLRLSEAPAASAPAGPGERSQGELPIAPAASKSSPMSEPIVRMLVEKFDGRIVDIQ